MPQATFPASLTKGAGAAPARPEDSAGACCRFNVFRARGTARAAAIPENPSSNRPMAARA
jgi:hypothetical protein